MSALSAATGKDASHNAGQAQQASTAYQKQAAPLYSGLASEGSSLTNMFNSQFPGLLSMFEGAAGLPNTVGGTNPLQASGSPSATATGAAGATSAASPSATGNTAAGGGKAPAPQANAGAGQTAAGLQQSVPANLQAYAASNPTFNPYQLNPNAQAYLSAQLSSMDQTTQSTINSYQGQLAQMGIQDSSSAAAGASWINQQAQQSKNSFVSNFMLQQQQQQEAAAAQLLSTVAGVGAQGASETGQGASGLAGLAGQNQQTALQEQQLSNQQMAGVGSFLGQFIPGGSIASAMNNYGVGTDYTRGGATAGVVGGV